MVLLYVVNAMIPEGNFPTTWGFTGKENMDSAKFESLPLGGEAAHEAAQDYLL